MKTPTISTIIPIYNVKDYLSSAIQSVIDQDIGFSENVELILVNDGSTDGSGEICHDFLKRYPNNIRYIEQSNQGVSTARNNGLAYARGKYVNFLDADDIWQRDAYRKMITFLDDNKEIDFVASKIKFFDRSIDEHPLNYKFTINRVIDVNIDPDSPIMHIISCIIRREALDGKSFDVRLKVAEDAKLLNEILAVKKRYGVVVTTQYNYRKRGNSSSAIDGGQQKKEYYLETPALAYESMSDDWRVDDKLHPYMQNLLLYDISYRISGAPYRLLSSAEEKKYATIMHRLLVGIEQEYLDQSRWYTVSQKRYLLSIKKKQQFDKFSYTDMEVVNVGGGKYPFLNLLFNWRFRRMVEQFHRLRRYNLTQLTAKAKLIEYAKPWLISAEAIADIPRAIILRMMYHVAIKRKAREIWIISDRAMAAGDNGEAFFSYIQKQHLDVDIFFALSKKSKDYKRIEKIGPITDYGSWDYLVKFLLADKIISSHADIETTNPFIRNIDHYQDLIHHDFIFLQHGVISNDLSSWLNKRDKRISLFITSSKSEYDAIVNNPAYGYTSDEVKITGLARWDLLKSNPQNKLIIAPTFRASLLKTDLRKDGTRVYDGSFRHSQYFRFYHRLIHDERVNKALAQKGMVGEFYVHPNFAQQISDFKSSSAIKIAQFPYDYRTAISEGIMLVTDYSSVAYDFAYLLKPVIYTQFDIDAFYRGQIYSRSYAYSYERDGLGPIVYDYESTVKTIIEYIIHGCRVKKEYESRINNYFTYRDKNNRQRILGAVLEKD